jgi:hypothetical protein
VKRRIFDQATQFNHQFGSLERENPFHMEGGAGKHFDFPAPCITEKLSSRPVTPQRDGEPKPFWHQDKAPVVKPNGALADKRRKSDE